MQIFFRYIAVCHPFIIGKDRGHNHTTSVRGGRINRQNDRFDSPPSGNGYTKTSGFEFNTQTPTQNRALSFVQNVKELFNFIFNYRNNSCGLSSHNSTPLVRKRTLYYMVPAISVALMINVPKFMEFRTVKK